MDTRRSIRRSVILPVILSGKDFKGLAFNENTWTIGVNKHGAKISTSYRMAVGDKVTVGNPLLGVAAKGRVVRVTEAGRAFEVGVELLVPQDVWGSKSPTDASKWESEGGNAMAAPADQELPNGDSDPALKPESEDGSQSFVAPTAAPPQERGEAPGQIDLPSSASPEGEAKPAAPQEGRASSLEPHFQSLADFLRASGAELGNLLAKTQEIQRSGWQAIQVLLEEAQVRFHQELEAASAGFVNETRNRIQHAASAALGGFDKEAGVRHAALLDDLLGRSQEVREGIEVSLEQGTQDYQRKLAESSTSALEEFRLSGKSLFGGFQTELRETFDDLKKRGTDEVSGLLKKTADELDDEIRRRTDAHFGILNDQLTQSAKVLLDETQHQIAALSDSALAGLTQQASDTVNQRVSLGVGALDGAVEQSRATLETHLRQSIERFEKQIEELSRSALEKNNKTSELFLHNLQSRLDQASRALQLISPAAMDEERKHLAS